MERRVLGTRAYAGLALVLDLDLDLLLLAEVPPLHLELAPLALRHHERRHLLLLAGRRLPQARRHLEHVQCALVVADRQQLLLLCAHQFTEYLPCETVPMSYK